MGAELAKAYAPARAVFAEVDEALDQTLSKVMWEGPEDQLTLTENAQPALMAVSLAALRTLEAEKASRSNDRVSFVAGHSLGEYSALAAAGSLSLADTARLLKTRGRAMQEAVPVGQGAMAALLGAELPQAQELCQGRERGRSLRSRQRQCARPGGDQRHPRRDRAGDGACAEIRRPPRRAASRERALPLRADAACSRCDERGLEPGRRSRRRRCPLSPMCSPRRSAIRKRFAPA